MMTARFSYPWIINKRNDLLWLIGPVLFSFVILVIFLLFTRGKPSEVTSLTVFVFFLVWGFLFDNSHFFATYTRTYFDKPFFRQNKVLLLLTLTTFLIGPFFIGLPFLLSKDVYLLRNTFTIFNRFCISMAYFHVVRQHWGIIALYRRRNNETDDFTRRSEHAILLIGCFLPFLHFQYSQMPLLSTSEIMSAFQVQGWHKEMYYLLTLAGLLFLLHLFAKKRWSFLQFRWGALLMVIITLLIFAAQQLTLKTLMGWLCSFSFIAFVVVIIRYVMHQSPERLPINVPKWLLLITVIIVHAVFIELPIPFLLKPVLLGIYHNIQYHRIVYHHNQNKYTGADKSRFGLAAVFANKFGILLLGIFLFGVLTAGLQVSARFLFQGEVLGYFVGCVAWAIPLHHYWLDAVIWRLRNNERLLQHLKASPG